MGPGFVLAERYRVEFLLGEGSAGKVWVGEHLFLKRKVSIKIVSAERADVSELVQRFEREAMVAAGSENPHIVGAVDFGTLADGSGYFVAEYAPGRSLRQEILAGRLPIPRALHIARQLGMALADAHELGIVHHDIKPENLMLIRRGDDSDFLKLLDFGLARAEVLKDKEPSGERVMVLGTPEYRAPEQARGKATDRRADLYSLGVVLFEMVAGARPFDGGAVLRTKSASSAPTLAERTAGGRIPAELEQLIAKLLAIDPADRPQTAEDVLEALDRLSAALTEKVEAGAQPVAMPGPPAKPSVPPPRSNPPVARASTPPAIQRPKSGPPPAAVAGKEHVAVEDDSNVPTRMQLPKVKSTPPPPAAAEVKPRNPLAATVITRGRAPGAALAPPGAPGSPAVSASTPSYAQAVRAKASAAYQNAPPWMKTAGGRLRESVRGRERLVLGGAVALTFSAVLLTFAFAGSSGSEATHKTDGLRVGLNAASPASTSVEPALASTAQPALKQVEPAATAMPVPSGEASVFLRAASTLADEKRDAEAVALVSRVLIRQPELKSDPRVGAVLARTARSETSAAAEESFNQLATAMGEQGAAIIYALALDGSVRDTAKKRAETFLQSKDFDKAASAGLYTTVKLRAAKTCEQKRALLGLAGDVGEQPTLDYLRDLEARVVCRANDLANCYSCLAQDARLGDAISRIEKRIKK